MIRNDHFRGLHCRFQLLDPLRVLGLARVENGRRILFVQAQPCGRLVDAEIVSALIVEHAVRAFAPTGQVETLEFFPRAAVVPELVGVQDFRHGLLNAVLFPDNAVGEELGVGLGLVAELADGFVCAIVQFFSQDTDRAFALRVAAEVFRRVAWTYSGQPVQPVPRNAGIPEAVRSQTSGQKPDNPVLAAIEFHAAGAATLRFQKGIVALYSFQNFWINTHVVVPFSCSCSMRFVASTERTKSSLASSAFMVATSQS